MMVSKRNLLFQVVIFRFHVKLWEGNFCISKHYQKLHPVWLHEAFRSTIQQPSSVVWDTWACFLGNCRDLYLSKSTHQTCLVGGFSLQTYCVPLAYKYQSHNEKMLWKTPEKNQLPAKKLSFNRKLKRLAVSKTTTILVMLTGSNQFGGSIYLRDSHLPNPNSSSTRSISGNCVPAQQKNIMGLQNCKSHVQFWIADEQTYNLRKMSYFLWTNFHFSWSRAFWEGYWHWTI